MSSINIDPIIRVSPDRKIRTVIVGITAGTNNGSAPVPGLQFVEQILSWSPFGAGTSVAFGAASQPFITTPTTVGISLTAAGTVAGVSVLIQVQGQ